MQREVAVKECETPRVTDSWANSERQAQSRCCKGEGKHFSFAARVKKNTIKDVLTFMTKF